MPRQARLDAPGTLHHVMFRGLAGGQIVADGEDRATFLARKNGGGNGGPGLLSILGIRC